MLCGAAEVRLMEKEFRMEKCSYERFPFRLHHSVFYFLFKGGGALTVFLCPFLKIFFFLLALLLPLTKKRLTKGTFLSLVKSRKKTRIEFLNVLKAIVLVKTKNKQTPPQQNTVDGIS